VVVVTSPLLETTQTITAATYAVFEIFDSMSAHECYALFLSLPLR
jgi:hypothetical protein